MPGNGRPHLPVDYRLYRIAESIWLDQGYAPQRIATIMIPVYAVTVREERRTSVDYTEMESLLVRAIGYADLTTVDELASFFGVIPSFVARFLYPALRTHFEERSERSDARLVLTPIGRASLADTRHYEVIHAENILCFDALGGSALHRDLYDIPRVHPSLLSTGDAALPALPPLMDWDPQAIVALLNDPDRQRKNVPDEVVRLDPTDVDLVYLPACIVKARAETGTSRYLGYVGRQRPAPALSALMHEHAAHLLAYILPDESEATMRRRVREIASTRLNALPAHYTIEQAESGEWRVVLTDDFVRNTFARVRRENRNRIGRYMIMDSYIVRLWSANEAIRQEEACEQIGRQFQGIESDPSLSYLREQVVRLCRLYDIASLDLDAARAFANANDMPLAAERLTRVADMPTDGDDAERTRSEDGTSPAGGTTSNQEVRDGS